MEISKVDLETWIPVINFENNTFGISGSVAKEFTESRSNHKNNFYSTYHDLALAVKYLSHNNDNIKHQ